MQKRNWLALAGLMLAVLASCGCPGPGKKEGKENKDGDKNEKLPRLQGAGSSFVFPMMEAWSTEYKKEKGSEVNYQSKGSGTGITMMTEQKVDFGCSDAPLNEEQLKKAKDKGGDVIHIPLCMGAIVLAYNKDDLPEDLVFTPEVLAGIYTGKITKWGDDAIKKANKGKKLPDDLKISPVSRSDASGSTYIFTDYLSKAAPGEWKKGAGLRDMFPGVGTSAENTAGVAGAVEKTKGAIGYVELLYALKAGGNVAYGQVVNKAGKPVKATLASVTAAAESAEIPDDLCFSLTNPPGEKAYPIAGTVWAVCYVKQEDKEKARALKAFLTWITHDGQERTKRLHYAALPKNLVEKIEGKLKLIEAK